MTKAGKLRIINAILELNAAIVDEPVKIRATAGPKGWIRIGIPGSTRRQDSRQYPDIDRAVAEAFKALERARDARGFRPQDPS